MTQTHSTRYDMMQEKEDVRPIGPNKQFLALLHSPVFAPLRASHNYVFLMSPDTHVYISQMNNSPKSSSNVFVCDM
jgi:hypothetical protein